MTKNIFSKKRNIRYLKTGNRKSIRISISILSVNSTEFIYENYYY